MQQLLTGAAMELAGWRPHVASHPVSSIDHPHLDDLLHKIKKGQPVLPLLS
jgi:hypothetical protein